MKIYYDHRYNTTALKFDTVRKADCIRRSLEERPIVGVELVAPAPVSWEDLELVHTSEYLQALRTGEPVHVAAGAGIGWDELYSIAIRWSTGGLCAAAREALETGGIAGSLSSGLHHAHRDHGLGYCSVNGLALAAVQAVERGVRRVVIFDFDAHCGGGTAEIIAAWPQIEQVDVSVVRYDDYPSRDDARLYLMSEVHDGEHYLDVIRRALDEIDDPSSIDLVIYNAGMDPHGEAGGRSAIDTETLRRREEMVFAWARTNGVPVAWTVAGGYSDEDDMGPVVDLHRLTVEAAVAHTNSRSTITPSSV